MESRNFIYAPLWVKAVALGVLIVTLLCALFIAFDYVGQADRADWILMAMSLGQVAASGLVLAIIVFFSERDVGVVDLHRRAEAFFYQVLPSALSLIDSAEAPFRPWSSLKRHSSRVLRAGNRAARSQILVSHAPGRIEAYYRIRSDKYDRTLLMRVQLNIGEIVASFYFPARSSAEMDGLKESLGWAFGRLIEVSGYSAGWYFSREAIDGRDYVSVHLTRDHGEDFLENERKKLFVANDFACNIRGLLKDCAARGIRTSYRDGEVA